MILAVTGSIGAGKSSVFMSVAVALKSMGYSTAGLISARLARNGERSGYELLNLTDGATEPLATLDKPPADQEHLFLPLCHLFFHKSALASGNDAIFRGLQEDCLIIDEVGHWELSGGGWAEHLALLRHRHKPVILGMRLGIADELKKLYGIDPAITVHLDSPAMGNTAQNLVNLVTGLLGRSEPGRHADAATP